MTNSGYGPIQYKAIVALIGEPAGNIYAEGNYGTKRPLAQADLVAGHSWICGCIERSRGFGGRTWWPCAEHEELARKAVMPGGGGP